jgi:hypothetical protein
MVGAARVQVADVGGEEFEEPHAGGLAGGGDELAQKRRLYVDELVHFTASPVITTGPKPGRSHQPLQPGLRVGVDQRGKVRSRNDLE